MLATGLTLGIQLVAEAPIVTVMKATLIYPAAR